MCLDAASPQGPVKIVRCHGMGGNQAWVYNNQVSLCNMLLVTIKLLKVYWIIDLPTPPINLFNPLNA